MILHHVSHGVRPEDGFRGLGVVLIDRGRVTSYRIDRRGARYVLAARRLGPATTDDPPGHSPPSLDVSPSGRLVALVSRKGLDDRVAVLDVAALRIVGSWHVAVPTPIDKFPISTVTWSPDSTHLFIRFPGTDGILTDVRGRRRFPVARGEDCLAWSRSGRDLYVVNEGKGFGEQGLAWTRYGVDSGAKGLVDFARVRRSIWYGPGSGKYPQVLDIREPTWGMRGAFWPYVRSDHDIFAIDLVVDRRGRHLLNRKGVMNSASEQRYLGDRVVYLQEGRLFDDRPSEDGTVWLGRWDIKSGKKRQVPLIVGDVGTRLDIRLVKP